MCKRKKPLLGGLEDKGEHQGSLPPKPSPCRPRSSYHLGAGSGLQTCSREPVPPPALQPVLTEISCCLQDFLKPQDLEIKSRRFFPWMLLQCTRVVLCDGFCVTQ